MGDYRQNLGYNIASGFTPGYGTAPWPNQVRPGSNDAPMRSEAAMYEIARRQLEANPPFSMMGSILSPQQAALIDALRRGLVGVQNSTGYASPQDLFGSK